MTLGKALASLAWSRNEAVGEPRLAVSTCVFTAHTCVHMHTVTSVQIQTHSLSHTYTHAHSSLEVHACTLLGSGIQVIFNREGHGLSLTQELGSCRTQEGW